MNENNPWFISKNCVIKNFFDNIENQKKYALWLGKTLNYEKMDDWYNITSKNLKDNYGSVIIKKYGFIIKFLKSVFPEYEWIEWKFNSVPNGFWSDINNRKKFLEWLKQKLKYEVMEDWYNLTTQIIKENGGITILGYYNNSLIQMIKSYFPNYHWLEWKFRTTTMNYWNNLENRKKYAIWLGEELKYKNMEDWYKITQNTIKSNYGAGLLTKQYGCSNIKFLQDVFPDYHWFEWKFCIASQGFYKKIENRKKYIEWLGKILKYKTMEDWYKISIKDIKDNDGAGLIEFYNGSIKKILNEIFSDYEWLEWKFNSVPNGFWPDINNQQKYLEWLGKILNYKKMEDWYNISQTDIIDNYGSSLLSKYYGGSPNKLIQNVYPNYDYKPWLFNKTECNYWDKIENRKNFACWLGEKLKYDTMEDWYKITGDIISDNGAPQLLHIYNDSPKYFVKDIFPHYEWIDNKFKYKGYSRTQIEWLEFIMQLQHLHIQHAENGGEYKIPDTRLKVDGFCESTNTIYQFHGDYYHGNPNNPRFKDPTKINPTCKIMYSELYKKTLEIEKNIQELGYNLVVMWEYDWKKINSSFRRFQKIYRLKKI